MTKLSSIILAVLVGVSMAFQAPINTYLAKTVTTKISVLNNFLVGTIIILGINIFSKNLHNYKNITKVPPLYWIGGILGIIIVFASIKAVNNLGAGAAISIFVTAQLLSSILIDHLGLFGLEKDPITFPKAIGICLMIAGLKLIV